MITDTARDQPSPAGSLAARVREDVCGARRTVELDHDTALAITRHGCAPVTLHVTSLDGVVHLVTDAVIAGSDTGRYVAACGTTFMPAAMAEPDGAHDCPLCRAQQPPRRPRRWREPRWRSHS